MRTNFAALSFTALALALAAAPAAAQEPQRIAGELTDRDSVGDEQHRYDDHVVRLEAGQRYRLSLNSDAFDPVARLYRAGQDAPVAENDDSNESLNARINYTPAQGGDYRLRVSAFSAEGRGAYTAEIATLAPLPPGAAVPWSTSGRIEEGATDHYAEHVLRLEGGRRYVLTAEASDFDPIASLYHAGDDDPITQNDDSGGTLNSRIAYAPAESGDYVLRVTPLSGDGHGAYRAAAALAPPLPAPLTFFSRMEATIWRVYTGELSATDPEAQNGARFDDYLVHFDAGQERLIMLDAEGFDTVVQILRAGDRDGEPLSSNDDSGGTLNSLLQYRAEEAGDYIVRVTALNGDAAGAYRLRVSER